MSGAALSRPNLIARAVSLLALVAAIVTTVIATVTAIVIAAVVIALRNGCGRNDGGDQGHSGQRRQDFHVTHGKTHSSSAVQPMKRAEFPKFGDILGRTGPNYAAALSIPSSPSLR